MKTEHVRIECDETRLYGELHIPERAHAPALLICHGMDSRGFHGLGIYSRLARVASENEFVALVFDFRGVGKSDGEFDYGTGEQTDVKCAIKLLKSRPEVDSDMIFVVGHSLGGAIALYALQHESPEVRGLVLWSPPKNHDFNVKKFIARTRGKLGLYSFLILSQIDKVFNVSNLFRLQVFGITLRLKDVRGKLMKLDECQTISKLEGVPVLIVIGDEDIIVGQDEARAVFESANEPKDFLVIYSAGHNFNGKEEKLISETMNWIRKWEQKKA